MVASREPTIDEEAKVKDVASELVDSDSEVALSTGDINYRNVGWIKCAGLLFSEYICLAIMSFPGSYAALGLVPGLIVTAFIAAAVCYTGFIITDYCIANPGITSVNDIGKRLFWNSKVVWWLTAACFICNNTLIQALHVLTGAEYFNTISDNQIMPGRNVCSVVFGVVSMIACFLLSIPRTFSHMSYLGYFSALTMFVAVILSIIFAGVEDYPNGYTPNEPIQWDVVAPTGSPFYTGVLPVLNITYTLAGQVTYPSFISQMRRPQDFKKALVLVTVLELILFCLAGSIVYVYVGNEYMAAPAFGVLSSVYKKISFSFALPTLLFLGSLYSNVSAQFLFEQIFGLKSKHHNNHTLLGWSTWLALNGGLWIIAFVIAEVIPFFSDLLSLMSSLFDCWFGFIFWGVAYFRLRKIKHPELSGYENFKQSNLWNKLQYGICWFLIGVGFFLLGPGTYSTVQSIIKSYQNNLYGKPFACASNGL